MYDGHRVVFCVVCPGEWIQYQRKIMLLVIH